MKSTKMVLILVLALGLASVSLAAEDTWTTKADMPTRRYVLSSSVVDGKVYAFGGTLGGNVSLSPVEAYYPVTDTWTRKADMPIARGGAASSVVNGKIYVMGGGPYKQAVPYSSVIEYDATTDTWTVKANMPTARICLSSSVVNGKIYAIGGASRYKGTPFSTVEEYDPATDTWTRKADMPTPRGYVSTSAVNGKIYAIGGTLSNPWHLGLSTVEEYDPATDTWTRKADMPTARTYLSTSAVNGKIYAIGGSSRQSGYLGLSAVEEYDPTTDTWTRKADMPTARCGLATSAVNGKIYAIGGYAPGAVIVSTVEEYDTGLTVVPSPDFNADGIVDSVDMCMMVDHWHTDNALYDIAPAPFGDGIVDIQDLIVLSEHLFTYPGTVAYWKLDETEGTIAYDSVFYNDGTCHGEPLWQPTAGQIDGALAFDGIDDYVSTPFVLNPAAGTFSVFVWIRGGAPGQAILSQADTTTGRVQLGSTWLGTDPSDGKLITALMAPPFAQLMSESVVTDDQWHHVGLVYDLGGFRRHLYVDGVEVAKDTGIVRGVSSGGGLYIGAGKNLEPGSFFSGLIDDVRIYNRAITP